MKRTILAMALILIALLSSCGKAKIIEEDDDTEDENVETQNPYSLEDFDFTLIETIRKQSYGEKLFIANYVIPVGTNREEIYDHSESYVKTMCSEDKEIDYIIVDYYENEFFSKYYDSPLVSSSWRRGDTTQVYKEYNPRNEEYALTENEMELYVQFQETYYSIAGEYAPFAILERTIRDEPTFETYKSVADKMKIDVQELINIRIKVSMYCLRYISDDPNMG